MLRHEDVTQRVIGVFYEVYNELGHGFLESVYQAAMAIALRQAGLYVQQELPIDVRFRGTVVGEFKADFVVERCLLVEIKAVRALDSTHEVQILNYLRTTDIEVGLLMYFGPKPEFKPIFDSGFP